MAYVVYHEDPTVHSAQEAERRGLPYWPTVRMGTFGELGNLGQPTPSHGPARPAPSGCPSCRMKSKSLGQSAACPPGQSMTPSGACVDVEPGMKMHRIGWIIATASAIAVVGLFAATLTLGTRGG